MPDDGVRAQVTRPRSAATKPKERPSTRSDMTQAARPASWRPSPAATPQGGWAPAGRNITPANDLPDASSQLPGSRLTALGGRRTRNASTNRDCSTRKAPPMRLWVRRWNCRLACAASGAPAAPAAPRRARCARQVHPDAHGPAELAGERTRPEPRPDRNMMSRGRRRDVLIARGRPGIAALI